MIRKTGEADSVPERPSGSMSSDLKNLTDRTEKVAAVSIDTSDWIIEEKGWHYETKLFDPEKDVAKWELEAESHKEFGPIVWRPDEDDPNYDVPVDESELIPEENEVEKAPEIKEKENIAPSPNEKATATTYRLAHMLFLYMLKPLTG